MAQDRKEKSDFSKYGLQCGEQLVYTKETDLKEYSIDLKVSQVTNPTIPIVILEDSQTVVYKYDVQTEESIWDTTRYINGLHGIRKQFPDVLYNDAFGYKLTDSEGLGLNNTKYEVGNRYQLNARAIEICSYGTHFCWKASDTLQYCGHLLTPYRLFRVKIPAGSVVHTVEEGYWGCRYSKSVTNDLFVVREITGDEKRVLLEGTHFLKTLRHKQRMLIHSEILQCIQPTRSTYKNYKMKLLNMQDGRNIFCLDNLKEDEPENPIRLHTRRGQRGTNKKKSSPKQHNMKPLTHIVKRQAIVLHQPKRFFCNKIQKNNKCIRF